MSDKNEKHNDLSMQSEIEDALPEKTTIGSYHLRILR